MPNKQKHIDLSYLNSIADNDQNLIKELVDIFLEQLPEFTEGLSTAYERRDWSTIASLSHKAKSSVVSMGMEDLGNIDLKNLELLAKRRKCEELANHQDEKAKKEHASLDANLKSYPPEKQIWVIQNANDATMKEIIDKFVKICEQAREELHQTFGK